MIESLWCLDTFGRLCWEQAREQKIALWVGGDFFVLTSDYARKQLCVICCAKRQLTPGQQEVKYAACSPHICLSSAVFPLLDDFRRHVSWRTTVLSQFALRLGPKTQIDYLQFVCLFAIHQVRRFDISMANALFMNRLQPCEQLSHDALNLDHRQPLLGLKQCLPFCILHNDQQVCWRLNHVKKFCEGLVFNCGH